MRRVVSQEDLWALLKTGDSAAIRARYGDVMEVLSAALRGAIVASPGKQLYVADYASIEARVLLWLADDYKALDIFARGEDIYCEMASEIYGRPITKADKDERQLGKAATLACGYGMGASKFVDTAAKAPYNITVAEDFAKRVVDAYRSKFYRVKQLWEEQQATAIEAVHIPQETVTTAHVSWLYDDDEGFLFCTLPSGRRLAYPEPEVHAKLTPWGEYRDSLTFMGIDTRTRKWTRQFTYGGSIVENEVQGIARDLLANALLLCEQSGVYLPVLSVHDESICEATAGDLQEFIQLMTTLPDWAEGCPVAVDAWEGARYHKA